MCWLHQRFNRPGGCHPTAPWPVDPWRFRTQQVPSGPGDRGRVYLTAQAATVWSTPKRDRPLGDPLTSESITGDNVPGQAANENAPHQPDCGADQDNGKKTAASSTDGLSRQPAGGESSAREDVGLCA